MKRLFAVAFAASLLAGPLYAAEPDKDDPMVQLERVKKEDRASVDRQFDRTMQLHSSKDAAPVKIDPWSNMRGPDDTKGKK